MMAIKHIRGNIKEILTAGKFPIIPISIIEACIGGSTEPPSIAIINPAAPNFASSHNPFKAIP